jgi:hypothetical protein
VGAPNMKRAGRLGLVVIAGLAARGCSSSPPPTPVQPAVLQPGEYCDSSTTANDLVLRFDPPTLVVALGGWRPARLLAAPDLCEPLTATFAIGDSSVAQGPTTAALDYHNASWGFTVNGLSAGKTTLTVTAQRAVDAMPTTATLALEVRDTAGTACNPLPDAGAPMMVDSGMQPLSSSTPSIKGTGVLGAASLSVPPGAFARTDELALPAFSADIASTADLAHSAASQPIPLGPAVSFTPQDPTWLTHSLRRELDFAIPVSPQCMPSAARLRHVALLYSGPLAHRPRVVTVADPRMEELPSGDWVMHFSSPWFGSYQAVVEPDAGTRHFKRHLTHRGVMGISMGGIGSATFGLRHHDQFDLVGPLGGPSDFTWLLWYVEKYALGGFCTVSDPNCPKYAPNLYPLNETYVHTMDYEHWWYQDGQGNGGTFGRNSYIQIFEDLALGLGNPNGGNADPSIPFMAPGPKSTDPFVSGNMTPGICNVTVDPIGPNAFDPPDVAMKAMVTQMQQQQLQTACINARCDPKSTWIAPRPYYNADYNPDGSRQVISFCDGGQKGTSPYDDTWAPPDASDWIPVNMGLAVDLNKNGKRDEGEPILREGHEPWSDTGVDGIADVNEPFYDPKINPDPNQDDYDFQLNPNGTEGNHRYDQGEPFQDVGIDGVPGTPQQKDCTGNPPLCGYDVGEGDGVFTMAPGLVRAFNVDGDSILRGRAAPASAPLDDDAFERIGTWTDGGVRDLFNFAALANHFEGAVASRLRADGTPIKSTAFYNGFEQLAGQDPTQPNNFYPWNLLWDDIAAAPHIRFGTVDATPDMIAEGDGQHVGTGNEIVDRLVAAFYFSAHAWSDAPRTAAAALDPDPSDPGFNAETTTQNELGTACEITGACDKIFTGPKTGRTGPIAVVLPPGYALEALRARGVRYPVLYVLHGYGQDPRDLQGSAAITGEYMSGPLQSTATRLASMIVVYVDGRCRIDPVANVPECIRGTFWLNSPRTVNGRPIEQMDDWFEEVMQYVDQNYRTMGPSDVDVIE